MSAVVLDCSAALCWCFADEESSASQRLLDRVERFGGWVPPIWRLEIANVLLLAERRKRIEPGGSWTRLNILKRLPITVESAESDIEWTAVVTLAAQEGLTTYDASYLDLAIRQQLPLATKDRDLIASARTHNVAVVLLSDS